MTASALGPQPEHVLFSSVSWHTGRFEKVILEAGNKFPWCLFFLWYAIRVLFLESSLDFQTYHGLWQARPIHNKTYYKSHKGVVGFSCECRRAVFQSCPSRLRKGPVRWRTTVVSQSLAYNHCVDVILAAEKVVRTSVHMIVPICLSTPWLEFYLPEYSPSQGLNSRQQGMGGAGTVIVLYCKCSRG